MIRIFNERMDYTGLLESFDSFSCSAKYADKGTFSIKASLTKTNKHLLKIGYFIQYKDFVGIIDSLQYNDSGTDTLIASGQDLVGLLDKRVIWNNQYFNGTSEGFLRKIVNENAINPSNPKRKIPFLTLGKLNNLPQTTVRNTQNEKLLSECQKVCNVADYGFKFNFNQDARKLEFEVYEGRNRVAGQPNQVILSKEYDNVVSNDYIYSEREKVSTCLVNAVIEESREEQWKAKWNIKGSFPSPYLQVSADEEFTLHFANPRPTDTVENIQVTLTGTKDGAAITKTYKVRNNEIRTVKNGATSEDAIYLPDFTSVTKVDFTATLTSAATKIQEEAQTESQKSATVNITTYATDKDGKEVLKPFFVTFNDAGMHQVIANYGSSTPITLTAAKGEVLTLPAKEIKEYITVPIGDEAEGFARNEIAIDSSTSKDELTYDEFIKVLKSEGNENLVDVTQCLDVDVTAVDLKLGDKVTVKQKEWGLLYEKRVTEKQLVVQNGSETVTFLLGEDIKVEVNK